MPSPSTDRAAEAPGKVRLLVVSNMYPGPGSPYYGAFVARHVELLGRDPRLSVRLVAIRDARKGRLRSAAKYAGLAGSYAAALASFRPQVVHFHYALPTGLLAAPLVPLGVPYLVTLHGGDVYEMPAKVPGGGRLLAAVLGEASRVIAVGRELAAEVERRVPAVAGRVRVVDMGVDDRFFAHEARAPRVPERLAFVGQLIERKGADVLLEALARVRARHPRVSLDVVGDGPARARLEARAVELGLGEPVAFRGATAPESVPDHLDGRGCLVVPSRREPLGVVALEAMALGLVVVASRVGGLAELVGADERGFLAEPGDPASLAQALERALTMPAAGRDELVTRARSFARTHSVAKSVEAVTAEVLAVAGARRRRPGS